MLPNFSIDKAFNESLSTYLRHFKSILKFLILPFVVGLVGQWLMWHFFGKQAHELADAKMLFAKMTKEVGAIILIFSVLQSLFYFFYNAAFKRMSFKFLGDQGTEYHASSYSFKDFFTFDFPLFTYLAVAVVYMLLGGFGLMLLIIPGIYLLAKYYFATRSVIYEKSEFKEAFNESAELTKGIKLKIVGLEFLLGLIPFLFQGVIALITKLLGHQSLIFSTLFLAGVVLFIPFAIIVRSHVYLQMKKYYQELCPTCQPKVATDNRA